MNRRLINSVLFAFLAVPAVAFGAAATDSKTYKDIAYEDVFDAAREAIMSNGWKLRDESKEDGLLVARTKISAMSWGSLVSVNVTEAKKGVKVVASAGTDMSSSGKVNKDLERFFDKLDKKVDAKKDSDD